MYAVIRTGGKQYKVKAGDTLRVEKLEKNLGDEFDFADVLFVSGQSATFGAPTVKDAKVTVVVTQQSKNPKIIIFKRRRRQGYRRLNGHRQPFTELFIKAIVAPNGEKVVTEKHAQVRDPKKIAARKEAAAAEAKANRKAGGSRADQVVEKKAAKKTAGQSKSPAKKAGPAKKAAAAGSPSKAKKTKTSGKTK